MGLFWGLSPKSALDGKFVKEVMGVVSMVDCETGAPVAVASSRRKEGTVGECELPKGQKLIRSRIETRVTRIYALDDPVQLGLFGAHTLVRTWHSTSS